MSATNGDERLEGDERLDGDDDLNAGQLEAMDALWRATQAGVVTAEDAREIELVVRRGRPHAARKRLTEARRKHRRPPPP